MPSIRFVLMIFIAKGTDMTMKLLLLSLMLPIFSYAQVTHRSVLHDKKYAAEEGCGLKRFSMAYYDNEFVDAFGEPGRNRYSLMAAIWETTDPSCIRDYGVVQYIRGCVYSAEKDTATGKIKKYIRHVRESRGEVIRYKHPKWEVDTVDKDPLYNSNECDRFAIHRFVKIPLSLKNDAGSLRKDRDILFHNINYDFVMNDTANTIKQFFITDLPSGSSYTPAEVRGEEEVVLSSLEFKTCLYKSGDIPREGDPKAEAIQCYDWSDRMEFDFEEKSFKRVGHIDPFCLE